MPIPRRISSTLGLTFAHYAVSPDGTRIAFEGAAEGYVSSRLHVANLDGSALHVATTEPVLAQMPSWSPDGERIVYTGAPELVHDPGGTTLAVLTVATGETKTIYRSAGDIWYPSFSADGGSIIFTRQSGESLDLWSIPASGGRATIVRRNAAFGVYSPDGHLLAFRDTPRSNVFISILGPSWAPVPGISIAAVRADGTISSRTRQLGPSSHEPKKGWPTAGALWERSRPVWSPDGERIAYLDGRKGWGRVLVIEVETGIVTMVGRGTLPAWIDDGRLIVHR